MIASEGDLLSEILQLHTLLDNKDSEINALKAKMQTWIEDDHTFISEVELESKKLREALRIQENEYSVLLVRCSELESTCISQRKENDRLLSEIKALTLNEQDFVELVEKDVKNLKALIFLTDINDKRVIESKHTNEGILISELQLEVQRLKCDLEADIPNELHEVITDLRRQLDEEQERVQYLHSQYSRMCDQNSILREALIIKEMTIQKNLKVEIIELEEIKQFLLGMTVSESINIDDSNSIASADNKLLHHSSSVFQTQGNPGVLQMITRIKYRILTFVINQTFVNCIINNR